MARLTIFQDNYARWRWGISARDDEMADSVSAFGFDTREAAQENAFSQLGDEAELAHLVVDGETSRPGYVPPQLPKVDPKAEAMAAGVSTGVDADPGVGMGT